MEKLLQLFEYFFEGDFCMLVKILKDLFRMELLDQKEFENYIKENYKVILTNDSSRLSENYPGKCDFCQKDAYLRVGSRWHDHPYESSLPDLATFFIQCPSCKRQSFISTIILSRINSEGNVNTYLYDYYRLFTLPTQESAFETSDIPNEYKLLKKTVMEAKFTLQHGQYMSATIMFRRALEILVTQILKAEGKTLYNQLNWLKNNSNKLEVNLTELFHDNSDLIRKIGNQSAHPDNDEDLQEFSEEDANAVHDLFLLLVNEVFVIPAKLKAMKEDLVTRRKLK